MHYAVYLRKIKDLNSLTEAFWAVTEVTHFCQKVPQKVHLYFSWNQSDIFTIQHLQILLHILMNLLGSQILIIILPHKSFHSPSSIFKCFETGNYSIHDDNFILG